eukprot:6214118-Pleurochrysis_carterae.AAC.4
MRATEYHGNYELGDKGNYKVFAAIYADEGIYGISSADRMHLIGSYVSRNAGCHECKDHD